MLIQDDILGECELVIECDALSSVDSYICSGYSLLLDRELTDSELDNLQDLYSDAIQEYSYSNGYSLNHN